MISLLISTGPAAADYHPKRASGPLRKPFAAARDRILDPNIRYLLDNRWVPGCSGRLLDRSPKSLKDVEHTDNSIAAFLHESASGVN
jgi:hypothetical protein